MANFPSSISTNSNLYVAVNGLQTTLAVSCTSGDTTLTLTSTTGFPTTGLVTIDNTEIVSYTGISGATITGCTRGADGTTAASHPIGVTVGLTVVAAHHNLLKDEVIAIETALGVNLAGIFPVNLATQVTGILPNANTTATPNATASTIMSRDANVNTKINNIVTNFSTTVTAAGTTTLTAASSPIQQFTGTSAQTVTLPNATTLSVGFQFTILNRSTGIVSVNNNGGTLQQAIPATAQTTFTCTNISTANGVWDASTSSSSSLTSYREDYVVGTALNNYTGSLTVFDLVTPYSVGAHSLVVTLDGDVQTIGATVDYQETNSTRVTFVNSLVVGQKVSLIFQTATSSGGTVNSGTAGQVAYYPATGPTVSSTAAHTVGTSGANGIVQGTNTNDSAAAGKVGEFVSSLITAATSFPATGVFSDLTSISLTAGDWDVSLGMWLNLNGATVSIAFGGISLTSGNSFPDANDGDNNIKFPALMSNGTGTAYIAPWRISLAATTTVYFKYRADYTVATPLARGRISARRVR